MVVGLGNIYVDEALWWARIHPARPAASLKKPVEVKRLREQIIEVLQLGIEKRGSTIRTYRNALGEDGTMQDFCRSMGRLDNPVLDVAARLKKLSRADAVLISVLTVRKRGSYHGKNYWYHWRHCLW